MWRSRRPRAGVVHLAGVRKVPVAVPILLGPGPVPGLAERPLLVTPQGRDARPVPVPFLGPRQAVAAVGRHSVRPSLRKAGHNNSTFPRESRSCKCAHRSERYPTVGACQPHSMLSLRAPIQSRNHRTLDPPSVGEVRRQERLGGVFRHYYRKAG